MHNHLLLLFIHNHQWRVQIFGFLIGHPQAILTKIYLCIAMLSADGNKGRIYDERILVFSINQSITNNLLNGNIINRHFRSNHFRSRLGIHPVGFFTCRHFVNSHFNRNRLTRSGLCTAHIYVRRRTARFLCWGIWGFWLWWWSEHWRWWEWLIHSN